MGIFNFFIVLPDHCFVWLWQYYEERAAQRQAVCSPDRGCLFIAAAVICYLLSKKKKVKCQMQGDYKISPT